MKNIDKIVYYIKPFSKSTITMDGIDIECPVNSIKLGDKFFWTDSCDMCGRCCPPEYNVFVQFEWDAIQACVDDDILEYGRKYGEENGLPVEFLHSLKENTTKEVHTINGREVNFYQTHKPFQTLYVDAKGKEQVRCPMVHKRPDRKIVCGIHPLRSITCRMPHLRVYKSTSNNVSLNLSQFGRNWALGCSILFTEPLTAEEFETNKADRLEKLIYLERCAQDINITTYLPEVIAFVEKATFENYRDLLNVDILHYKTVKRIF